MKRTLASVAVVFGLIGCVQIPQGPGIAVMPAQGKPFDLFVREEQICRQFAKDQCGASSNQAATNSIASTAAVGTGVGAVAGAAIGATVGRPLEGAAIGAGAGLAEGSVIGVGAGYQASYTMQQRYDIAYEQCMYAKGNQLPGVTTTYANTTYAYPPPPPYHP